MSNYTSAALAVDFSPYAALSVQLTSVVAQCVVRTKAALSVYVDVFVGVPVVSQLLLKRRRSLKFAPAKRC